MGARTVGCSATRLAFNGGFSGPLRQFFPSRTALFSGTSLVSALHSRYFPLTVHSMERSHHQGEYEQRRPKSLSDSNDVSELMRSISKFALTNFLPIALISGVTFGLVNPTPGCIASRYPLTKFATFGIFFISGLKLRGGEIGSVIDAWPVGLFGLASILLISPCFSNLLLQFRLAPQEFIKGLAIFCCMPTTLSSGVALTQLVGGNSALALALTVLSNLLSTIAVPFWISNSFAEGLGVSIPTGQLFWNLICTILVPLILAKVLRSSSKGLATSVDQNRRKLSFISTLLLSLTPWMQVSKSRSLLLMVKPEVFLKAIAMGISVHLTFLCFNAVALKYLSSGLVVWKSAMVKKENIRALLLVCSQKALLIVVAVVDQLSGALGESGLLVLPCIAAHINQIIIDSLLVNYWIQKDQLKKASIMSHSMQ
ncbi:probable sodium/metabolite cotransporter BASS4, chloroplastic [Punica granatum]|uniref:Probable sodium/metabolite cotransporter BASS4, chloroplastic n=1 Tax=Punica granatum TaxID=22663 RepID=A0A218WLI9_PUNGR|nr:probable sodium/metabolite cotransporter BASS4, chloroplastic [Punica granatum]OWM73665.1 hypothetical protein CDL15_Pgr026765 [Punica granatum]